jgi:hypothetical protein
MEKEGLMKQEMIGQASLNQNDRVKHEEWIKAAWTSSNLT